MPPDVGEGMTGSRFPGLPSGTEPGTWTRAAAPQPSTPNGSPRSRHPDPDRLTDHASPDVGVKATPLRGRPCGPRLDPNAAPNRPAARQSRARRRASPPQQRLTGHAPSGMTWYFLVAGQDLNLRPLGHETARRRLWTSTASQQRSEAGGSRS